ncbi:hypothetical protein [Corynebacterium variabile]|uniref:hypothetical protein n=1 Tax=Corynebacterium variabile TaxID=1727 RepID=UPI003FD24104
MVDFNTLKGIDGYREAFPTVFDGMSDADAKRVVSPVHSSVLSGWEPSTDAVQRTANRILRDGPSSLTSEEIDALVSQLSTAEPRTEN